MRFDNESVKALVDNTKARCKKGATDWAIKQSIKLLYAAAPLFDEWEKENKREAEREAIRLRNLELTWDPFALLAPLDETDKGAWTSTDPIYVHRSPGGNRTAIGDMPITCELSDEDRTHLSLDIPFVPEDHVYDACPWMERPIDENPDVLLSSHDSDDGASLEREMAPVRRKRWGRSRRRAGVLHVPGSMPGPCTCAHGVES